MVESLRTIDRFRVVAEISEEEAVRRRKVLLEMLAACDMVEVSRRILARAAEPFAVALGTLDAIHLATALGWQEENAEAVVMATHDGALARAARAYGMEVKGV
jgi:predicted nucleic acid-binding protein